MVSQKERKSISQPLIQGQCIYKKSTSKCQVKSCAFFYLLKPIVVLFRWFFITTNFTTEPSFDVVN